MTRSGWLPKPTRWDRAVDPDEVLPLAERCRRADALRAAFYVAQGLKARERKRRRKGLSEGVDASDRIPPITADERRLRGRMGGLVHSAGHDRHEMTAAARAASDARFERLVDPDGTLELGKRRRRAEAARQAHYASMLLRSLEVSDAKRKRRAEQPDPDAERRRAVRRSVAGRIGAFTRLAAHDPAELTAKARQAYEARWQRLADPDGLLTDEERATRIKELKSSYYRELSQRRSLRGDTPSAPRPPRRR